MSENRLSTVKSAFQFLDSNHAGNGILGLDYLFKVYKPCQHPRVVTRQKTKDDIFKGFTAAITKKSKDGKTITESDFLDYYADINATLPYEKENYFVDLVMRTWGVIADDSYISGKRL